MERYPDYVNSLLDMSYFDLRDAAVGLRSLGRAGQADMYEERMLKSAAGLRIPPFSERKFKYAGTGAMYLPFGALQPVIDHPATAVAPPVERVPPRLRSVAHTRN
ncbi:hypothetical protein [Trinickia acidisoli]|uniref:hypothetical protein n=1 Tax=Trinickia acidisoli TaxID=2767482 RepID=UPI001A902CD7|nr:hypothetical protein [Trinickia acidisoli]